ncbi:MAG: acyl-CoA dehydrogenase family protein [Actinomycetota bacterium]|jgi:alkylation response protein AidB-like acyl-CoA dehydrogenase|nr:acyl-CoA dehydrogenase family protein [Actinomycetota bacterium]
MAEQTVAAFEAGAAAWLAEHGTPVAERSDAEEVAWGQGEFSVSVFHNMSHEVESAHLEALRSWNRLKVEQGYHAITWPTEFGGLGLSRAHARAYGRLERKYAVPDSHELFSVTIGLMAPTVRAFGTDAQKEQFISDLLETNIYCCQLFSEPGAGSDLAALGCRSQQDGDEWIVNGQKVWSSGAQFADWGLLISRSDVDQPKHKGMTAFMVPFDLPGVEVRPIKQMSGGTSFNEVFFNDARVPDSLRIGDVGEGWKVALTTLGFERDHSAGGGGGGRRPGGSWKQIVATARALGVTEDPHVREEMMQLYLHLQTEAHLNRRAADLARGGTPGPEGSLGKIKWTEGMRKMSDTITAIIGPRLVADTGEWGTYAWGEHVLGAPGYRIAGGSDEVQRNIIGERVLGLPGEPRVDKNLPWRDIPK